MGETAKNIIMQLHYNGSLYNTPGQSGLNTVKQFGNNYWDFAKK